MRGHISVRDGQEARSMGGSRRRRRRPRQEGSGAAPARAQPSASPARARVAELCELSPFSVFSALYLGLSEAETYSERSPGQVRRRFGLEEAEFDAYLQAHQLTETELGRACFDVESARFDIKVAPEGISKLEIARCLFEEFRSELERSEA